jgi:hypothetical protein
LPIKRLGCSVVAVLLIEGAVVVGVVVAVAVVVVVVEVVVLGTVGLW